MLQSKEGSKIVNEATQTIFKRDKNFEDSDEDVQESRKAIVSAQTLFPEIKSEADAPFLKTGQKLAFEEDAICKKMVKKYKDNTDKMHKDIKMNFLQWSEGQIRNKLKVYHKSLEWI